MSSEEGNEELQELIAILKVVGVPRAHCRIRQLCNDAYIVEIDQGSGMEYMAAMVTLSGLFSMHERGTREYGECMYFSAKRLKNDLRSILSHLGY